MGLTRVSKSSVKTGVKASSLKELLLEDEIQVEYVIVGGGGGGAGARGGGGGGGGAGGFLNSYASEESGADSSTAEKFKAYAHQAYDLRVGGGLNAGASAYNGTGQRGTGSQFDAIVAGGGGGASGNANDQVDVGGGSGGGSGGYLGASNYGDESNAIYARGGDGTKLQGHDGGDGGNLGQFISGGGGGGSD